MMLFLLMIFVGTAMANPHPQFVSLNEICPDIKIQMNYSTADNFTGTIVSGYKAPIAYLAVNTAQALCEVQKEATKRGYSLKIFDSYRPVKAVSFFQSWAKEPENNPSIKALYYPRYTREDLFKLGFIATKSSHSRGSAVDLTLWDPKSGKNLDMGSGFDYFDDIAHTNSKLVTRSQNANRLLLKNLMEEQGFKNFSQEWWHYSLKPELFPEEYFDFDVE